MRPSWDEWALGIALAVSQRGDCTRRQVGAVILDANRRVVSVGYNGTRPGEVGCLDGGCPRGRSDVPPGSPYDDCISSHAEQNALMHGDSTRFPGGTIYVTTEPCAWCTKMLRCSGLFRAVWSVGDGACRQVTFPDGVRGSSWAYQANRDSIQAVQQKHTERQ